jgi:D-arabinose 1-dehydrogenase-like Zn-dependent alcohol dehydrogenase
VIACAPGPSDLHDPHGAIYPRVPGAVIIGQDDTMRRWLCSGFLPCGQCHPCRASLSLACDTPARPGVVLPGGLADRVRLPRAFLAPANIGGAPAEVVALVAAAGPTYQAVASAGMSPGDAVVVLGDTGPGALPLRLLVELGLRPLWITTERPAPAGVMRLDALPDLEELPTARCHLIDLEPTFASLQRWLPFVGRCLSCTLAGPGLQAIEAELALLLAGQVAVRWTRDLHPHLALDVAAVAGRLDLAPAVECVSFDAFPGAFRALRQRSAARWPVLTPRAELTFDA